MTQWWTRLVADVADWFPGGLYGLLLAVVLVAIIVGLAIQEPALYRWRRRSKKSKPVDSEVSSDITDSDSGEAVPDLPADALTARAQAFMAAGDYRGAVREWLRVMVRDLIEADAITHRPGWTVTELASAGARAIPDSATLLHEAAGIFSEVWYGSREAELVTATRMRGLRDQLGGILGAYSPTRVAEVDR
ncbi:uncharacterized protein DUF4129 [Stackebrandtia endophytica]|uniref:Uncharacterized protein DUF4129 n=1 Tax=Stackebrandtia endophytica TaxID=1496996 RepID=A0A543AT59_9ACTN|nr:DUF4129 domain-containing protein [Stackebrandtia endophytica]TQL75763.1 uncharacterized protein DUF4129 [Stackebrandtia endophytica]